MPSEALSNVLISMENMDVTMATSMFQGRTVVRDKNDILGNGKVFLIFRIVRTNHKWPTLNIRHRCGGLSGLHGSCLVLC